MEYVQAPMSIPLFTYVDEHLLGLSHERDSSLRPDCLASLTDSVTYDSTTACVGMLAVHKDCVFEEIVIDCLSCLCWKVEKAKALLSTEVSVPMLLCGEPFDRIRSAAFLPFALSSSSGPSRKYSGMLKAAFCRSLRARSSIFCLVLLGYSSNVSSFFGTWRGCCGC